MSGTNQRIADTHSSPSSECLCFLGDWNHGLNPHGNESTNVHLLLVSYHGNKINMEVYLKMVLLEPRPCQCIGVSHDKGFKVA